MAHTDIQKDEIRNQIAEACVSEIAVHGLKAVTARSVAASIGKTHGWLYKYYSDFDAVVLAANSLTLRMLDEQLSACAAKNENESVADRFLALALSYMQFSIEHSKRWASLFEHQMTEGRELSPEHKREHYILFRHVEAPLAEIMKGRSEQELRSTARTIYSSVHGVVSLSLQGRLDKVPVTLLKEQLRLLTSAFAEGYARA